MTLTLTFALKIAFLDFVAAGGIVRVSQTHLDIFNATFNPLTTKRKSNRSVQELTIMWSRDGNFDIRKGSLFEPYYFVPIVQFPWEMGQWLTMLFVKIIVQLRFKRGSIKHCHKILYMVLSCRPWWNMVHHAGLLLTILFHGTWLPYLTMVKFILTMVNMIFSSASWGNRNMDIYSYFFKNVST